MDRFFKLIKSPVGELKLIASDAGLMAILWENDKPGRVPIQVAQEDNSHAVLLETEKQLNEYFSGRRKSFSLPLAPVGTDFQKKVWQALLNIPYGQTSSYGDLAKVLGNPQASRAVGAANGKNPISIVVPCHRVVGTNGALTGFAGGLKNKAVLLELERRGIASPDPSYFGSQLAE